MKKNNIYILVALILSLGSNSFVLAQESGVPSVDSLIEKKFRLDFTVPDIPAFKAMDSDPSEVLKPSSPKDLAVMFSSFRSGDEFIIPKSFAAEFAPGIYASTNMKLKDYQDKNILRAITKTRISIATRQENSNEINQLSGGIRIVLVDKGDFRNDSAFLNNMIYKELADYEKLIAQKKQEYLIAHNISIQEAVANESFTKSIEDTLRIEKMNQTFNQAIAKYKRDNWNATRLEFAYSIVGDSKDSLLENAIVDRHLFWLVYALKPGKKCNWAQIIFGLNEQIYRAENDKFYNQLAVNTRIYAGTNKVKGFAEAQFKQMTSVSGLSDEKSLFFNFGLDLDVYKGIWVHLSGGVDNYLGDNARSNLVANLNIYMTLPESFKLF